MFFVFLAGLLPALALSESSAALDAYKQANYAVALPLLRSAAAAAPRDAALEAALLSSLTQLDQVDEAADLDSRINTAFPNSPEVLAARGEWAYHMGDLPQAERLFKAATQINDNNARAAFGMSLLCRAASLYRTARLLCLRAHSLDPEDALITRQWLRYVPPARRTELIKPFIAAHPWLYQFYDASQETSAAVESAVGQRKIYELAGGPQEITLPLVNLMADATHVRALGLHLRLNGGRPLSLMLDTGASGILLKPGTIDRLGLQHLGSNLTWGIGDKGTRNMFSAVADTCQVGSLQFKTCVVGAVEGKGALGSDQDGLLGADFFSAYIISIDFQRHLLHLKPLPVRPYNPQGYDRQPLPEEAGFTPVFRFGSHLFVSTKVNNKGTGLFLLDTGSNISIIDSTFARLSTKLRGDDRQVIHGLSGSVGRVFEADKAEIQFSRFRQSNLGLTSVNLNNSSPVPELVRISGILGAPVLSLFRLTLDYRNGLVNFDYIGGR